MSFGEICPKPKPRPRLYREGAEVSGTESLKGRKRTGYQALKICRREERGRQNLLVNVLIFLLKFEAMKVYA